MRSRAIGRLLLLLVTVALLVLGLVVVGCSSDGRSFAEAVDAASEAKPFDAAPPDSEPADSSPTDASSNEDVDAAPPMFSVAAAVSTGHKAMTVTFSDPPDPIAAVALANYAVPGLTLSGTPTLAGAVVSIITSDQAAQTYTVTVSGVNRASDNAPLGSAVKSFNGRTAFNVASAASTRATRITVTFDAPPNMAQATNPGNYAVPGLTLSAPTLAGSVVTLTTTAQTAQAYTVTVTGVTRASDTEPLGTNTANLTGRDPFNVMSAASTAATTMTVTFDAAPNVAQATTRANYAVAGLTSSGTPVLVGNTVTITTSGQLAQAYTVTVSNVTRASDAEPLLGATANFTGTAVLAPTVTNVVVTSTLPNNVTTPYNTGTTTVQITGTDFATVACPAGVALDDLNGIDAAVGTKPTACTVDSDTQITATFPAGIRTKGATGWNVKVTNMVATNATSDVLLVPVAGLLVSEVYTGTGGATDHEFVEIYNPTGLAINTTAAGIGLKLHIRSSAGGDTNKTLTAVTGAVIPSHGFLLFVSVASAAGDAWFANRDYTYSDALVGNGGVYISLSATDNVKVIDKVGWGTQVAGGFEGTAVANIASSMSAERLPAGGGGHATDTDSNVADFNLPSAVITPRGTADAAQP